METADFIYLCMYPNLVLRTIMSLRTGVGLCTCGKSAEGDTASVKRTSEEFDGLTREHCANNKGI